MIVKIQNFMEVHHMLQAGDTVAAGVSGGADSVCLLFVLLKLQKKIPFRLFAVHVNHKIREEAGADAKFVEALCRQWGCPFSYVEEDVEGYALSHHMSTEEAGRFIRYQAFERILTKEGASAGKIAVAHNQNDNAETVLFHMLRGTGIRGLAGIQPVREKVIRPLLCVSRREIEEFLGKNQIRYCIDRTNSEDTYTRNKIRHHILTYAEQEICEKAVSHIYDTSVMMREAGDYICRNAQQALSGCAKCRGREILFDIGSFVREDILIQKEMLLLAMARLLNGRKDISRVHVHTLHQMFLRTGNGRIDLPWGLTAYREYETVRLAAGKEECPERREKELLVPGTTVWAEGMIFCSSIFPYEKNQNIPRKTYTKWFDYDKIIKPLVLRTRQTGDYLETCAEGGSKSLKAYLIGEKIPKAQRDKLTVLADGSHIVWVVGRRISERYKINKQTKTVLQIQVTGGTSDGREN